MPVACNIGLAERNTLDKNFVEYSWPPLIELSKLLPVVPGRLVKIESLDLPLPFVKKQVHLDMPKVCRCDGTQQRPNRHLARQDFASRGLTLIATF
jgi:hypothetical protein